MKAKGLLLILGFAASALLRPLQSAPFERWQTHDLDLGEWRDVLIFAKNKFWIRYAYGRIWSSEDGLDWTRTLFGPTGYGGLAFGNDIFVAPSRQQNAVSKDGLDWKDSFYFGPYRINDFGSTLAFGNGVFVLAHGVQNGPPTLYSTADGVNWTQRYSLETAGTYVASVSFVNGRFLASGGLDHAVGGDFLLVSTNGIEWSEVRAAAGETLARFWSIAFGDGKHVGVGTELVTFSLDSEFKPISRWNAGEGLMSNAAYEAGKFVAVGDHAVYSQDGIAWHAAALPKIGTLSELAYGNGRFVAIGAQVSAVSTNGMDWTIQGAALADVTGLVHADGKFVATGTKRFDAGSAVVISTNWGRWKAHDVLPGTNRVTELGYAEGKFLAAAGSKAYRSDNAKSWQEIETGFDGEIVALAHFQGRFWGAGTNATGDGAIMEAVPGGRWRIAKLVPKLPIVGIAASDTRIVAIAGTNYFQGFIYSSANGANWTENNVLIFRPYSIAWLAGRFVIGGHFAGRAISPDGMTWVQQADGQESLHVIQHTGSAFLAFHVIGDNSTRLLFSRDALSWERRALGNPQADAFRGYRQVPAGAVGSHRAVVVSGNVLYETELAPSVRGIAREGAGLRLLLGENWTGEAVLIEASEDLRNWSVAPNVSEAQPVVSDVSAARRFYRVKAE